MLKSNDHVPASSLATPGVAGQGKPGASMTDAVAGMSAMKLAMDRAHATHSATLRSPMNQYKQGENS